MHFPAWFRLERAVLEPGRAGPLICALSLQKTARGEPCRARRAGGLSTLGPGGFPAVAAVWVQATDSTQSSQKFPFSQVRGGIEKHVLSIFH